MQHWTITRERRRARTLTFDKAGATANTLSAAVLAELNEALDLLDREPPKGLIDPLGQGERLHRRRRRRRVRRGQGRGRRARDRAGAAGTRSSGSRTSSIRRSRWCSGFCLGGGLELALACRYRVVVDEPGTRLGLPEVMLGIVPGWGGIKRLPRLIGAPAALDLLLTGKTIDARRAKRLGDRRRMRAGAHHGEHRARRAAHAAAAAAAPVAAVADARSAGAPLHRGAGARSRWRSARGASTIRRRTRSSTCGSSTTAMRWPRRPSDPASIPSLLKTPTAANLIRVFRLQERLKSLGKEGDFKAAHVHVVGAGTMGGDIAAWCALRGLRVTLQDQNARAPGAGDAARGQALRRPAARSAPRARRERSADSGRGG